MKKSYLIGAAVFAICFSSCARIPSNPGRSVARLVSSRIDKEVQWHRSCFEDERIREIVQSMVCQELSVDMAAQIALLNNPRVQEAFEDIGIAQADLIEAGLLSNPVFEAFFRYPNKSGFVTNTEFTVTQNFIDIFLIPLKTKVAAAEFERAKLETANTILNLSFEVEEAYFELVAAHKRKELLKMMIDLAEIANQISTAQKRVDDINRLELQLRTAQYLEKTVELAEAEKEIIELREKLNKLMGLTGCDICWSIEQELPYIPDMEPSLECLELMAFNERLDIQAARLEVERFRRSFPTAQWWAFTEVQAGISTTREPDPESPRATGPAFSGQIPIFNLGQAARLRFFAQFRQAQARLAILEIEAYAEVRKARDTLFVMRNQVILYASRILPNQQQILTSREELYNIMATPVFELLDTKRNQLQAYLNYYMVLRDYWIARVELDKAVGGKLYLIGASCQEIENQEGCCGEGGSLQ